MPVTGDFAGLRQLEHTLVELGQIPRRAGREAAAGIGKLLAKEFSSGTDPYGAKWAKLKSGKPSHLTRSGRLRGTARARSTNAGVAIGPLASHGIYHQTGTSSMSARRILPDTGIPAAWRAVIERAIDNAGKKIARGK